MPETNTQNKNRKKHRIKLSYTSIFLGIWLTVGLFTLLHPHRDYSAREKRGLAKLSAPTLTGLYDGSYAQSITNYFSDHFACRDACITVSTNVKRLIGEREIGGVYLGKEDRLFLIPETPKEDSLNKNLAAIEAFTEKNTGIRSYFCLVPNAITVQEDKLPAHAPHRDQRADIEKTYAALTQSKTVDVLSALSKNADKNIYYKSDHHWTSRGAELAFMQLASDMEIENPVRDYEVLRVSEDFSGTLSAKTGRYDVKDELEIYLPKTEEVYSVEYVGEEKKTGSMYEPSALSAADQYTIFFGGNHGRVDMRSTAQTGRNLLVFKDSYFNTMAQFLWPYFDTIVIVDPRYYYAYAGDIVRQERITDILYLYNADTFGTDQSLYAVLKEQ